MRLTESIRLMANSEINAGSSAPFQGIASAANDLLQVQLEKFDNSKISRATFLKRSKNILSKSYKQAYIKGSGLTKLTSDGEDWINHYSKKQFSYLDKFATDIEAGEGTMDYDSRMEMYTSAIRAAYWGGTAGESENNISWVTTANESCEDCLEREAHGPYLPEELPGVPGDGSTLCGPRCRCYLVRAR